MNDTSVTLNFVDALGRRQAASAELIDGYTWRVLAVVGERTFSRECSSWQGVERTMFWLRRHGHEATARSMSPLAAAIVAIALLVSSAAAAQPALPTPAEQQFTAATRDYASMHRRLETALGPIEINADVGRINRAVLDLAAAIRAERATATPGDLFTPALAAELRARIADGLFEHGFTPDDVRESERADGVDPTVVNLRVNGPFPWQYGTAMFPCVLEALPELPVELQYRIVGDTLVLIDVHASLIVDLLPSALVPMTEIRP